MKLLASALLVLAACGDDTSPVMPDAAVPPMPDAALDMMPPGPDPLDVYTPAEQALLDTLDPLGAPPADTTNAYADSPAAAALGQMLFYDKSYSGALTVGDDATTQGLGPVGATGKVACASCHGAGGRAMDDQRSLPNNVSHGTAYGTRNAHGIVNSAYYAWTNWGGRFDSQWSLALTVSEGGATMKSTRLAVAHMLYDKYRAEYDAAFPTMPLDARLDPMSASASDFPPTGKPMDPSYEGMEPADKLIVNRIFVNFGKAIAAYQRKLVSKNAAFDRYRAGDRTAISDAAKRGLHTFLASCASCHGGPNFADDAFYALGVPQTGPNVPAMDLGRFQDIPPLLASPFNSNSVFSDDTTTGRLTDLAQDNTQRGAFRTKSLRNVATSAPYMHAGQHATLAEVVAFYNAGGGTVPVDGTKDPRIVPLGLSAAQQADLVTFMEALTGDPVSASLTADTSK